MSDHTQLPSVTMGPPTTFHPFPKLPWELRHEIWELAVRPLDRPGVHVFCVEEHEPDDSSVEEVEDRDKSNLHFSVPAATMSAGPCGNPSTYMIDGGLWTACKESRAVMEEAFKHQMWDHKRRAWRLFFAAIVRANSIPLALRALRSPSPVLENPYDELGDDELDMIPATAFFLSPPSSSSLPSSTQTTKADQPKTQVTTSPHYFSVFPHQDLFIFRPASRKIDNIWSRLELNFPFGSRRWGFLGFGSKHGLALKYDSAWLDDYYRDPAGEITGAVNMVDRMVKAIVFFDTTRAETIWLVDYRLKLKQNTPADKREPDVNQKVFYGNDGRRYVEMYSKFPEAGVDYLQWFYTDGVEGEDSSISERSCDYFIEEVEYEERWGPTLGLLACFP
ncbi:hypothetical protein QBC32DRAFT_394787 [Pseudoneurospora amorphoporcata]|uniref:2EXR domain-containing protein n=1 Tax=Pseudoneurospora amorphoporcata TaxID=241081 RepID=A0AAN6P268_9PEZI|nr:hypothetical protein QBC32DRAFT_394787 [Pseudoneurospora amorphoporcata]